MSLPVDRSQKRPESVWLRSTPKTQYVTVCSQVAWFMGHWSAKRRGSVKCLSDFCPACAGGEEARPFFYVAVVKDDGSRAIFEIPRRARKIAEEIEASSTKGVGVQLAIQREGTAQNSAINVMIVGFETVEEFDCWPFVRTLGLDFRALQEPMFNSTQATPEKSA